MRIVTAALLWLSFTGAASAHALWLEPDAAGYQLYFGEFGENLREGSPGLLDRFEPMPAAKAFGASGDTAAEGRKKPTSFQFAGAPEGSSSVVAEQARVTERKHERQGHAHPGRLSARDICRLHRAQAADPCSTSCSTGKPGSFKVFMTASRCRKAKAEVVSEFGWAKEFMTDDAGAFEVELAWKGTYIVEVSLVDATPGHSRHRP